MRILALVFVALIAALQYPLWLGKGGWLRVRDFDRQIEAQRDGECRAEGCATTRSTPRCATSRQGYEAIEERARSELGMIRQDEVFFQLQDEAAPAAPPVASPARPAKR